MFVLDDLYVSNEVLDFLEESQEPVLKNDTALRFAKDRNIRIASDEDVAALHNPDARIVALSEMHLDDVKKVCNESTIRAIEICKDKAACRRVLAPLFPHYIFEEYDLENLFAIDPVAVHYPVVIKPSTGFFSLGVYPVFCEEDWQNALNDIRINSDSWSSNYNGSVVNDAKFLVESYISGDEYAVDVYYDDLGDAVVLDILKHDFAGEEDVLDRLYYTSKEVIDTQLHAMTNFFIEVNKLLGLKNFPVHVEVRVQEDGTIIPIEFNPLRFAGLSTTDVSYFAYGFKTYEYFLQNKRPDWGTLLAGKEQLIYPIVLLVKTDLDESRPCSFDYDALKRRFQNVLELRKSEFSKLGTFGFMFVETPEKDWGSELQPLLDSTFDEFITYSKDFS